MAGGEITPDQADCVWSEMFASKANARSSKQLVRQTANWGVGRPYTDKKHGLQDNRTFYRDIQAKLTPAWGPQGQHIPACMHFGMWDVFAKNSMISQWHEALPQIAQHSVLYPETGHWVEETKGAEIARSILEVMDGS